MDSPVSLFESGEHERLKLAVHGGMLGLSSACLYYNARAWTLRKEPHLAVNTVIYLVLAVIESRKTWHHWQDC